jgi:hypothetical protein
MSIPAPMNLDKGHPEGLCYICRIRSMLESTEYCQTCGRSHHKGCIFLLSATRDFHCPECANICCKCWNPLSNHLICPRCQLRFHANCEHLMRLRPAAQLCSLCIKELSDTPFELVKKFGFREFDGQTYYLVQFRSVSLLHLSYVPANWCASVPISEE